jgi:RNA-binding protein 18
VADDSIMAATATAKRAMSEMMTSAAGGPAKPPEKRAKKEETEADEAAEASGASKRMFVGNLDMKVTEGHILKIFSKFGDVKAVQFLWHHSGPRRGQPRGYCFVEMTRLSETLAAIEALNGRKLKGRELRVNIAQEEKHYDEGELAPASLKVGEGVDGAGPREDDRSIERRVLQLKATLERMEKGKSAETEVAKAARLERERAAEFTSGRDWTCKACQATCYASRDRCYKCGKERRS